MEVKGVLVEGSRAPSSALLSCSTVLLSPRQSVEGSHQSSVVSYQSGRRSGLRRRIAENAGKHIRKTQRKRRTPQRGCRTPQRGRRTPPGGRKKRGRNRQRKRKTPQGGRGAPQGDRKKAEQESTEKTQADTANFEQECDENRQPGRDPLRRRHTIEPMPRALSAPDRTPPQAGKQTPSRSERRGRSPARLRRHGTMK